MANSTYYLPIVGSELLVLNQADPASTTQPYAIAGFDTDVGDYVLLNLYTQANGGSDDPPRNAGAMRNYTMFQVEDVDEFGTNIRDINMLLQLPDAVQANLASKQITDLSDHIHHPMWLPNYLFMADSLAGAQSYPHSGVTTPELTEIVVDAETLRTEERWIFTYELRVDIPEGVMQAGVYRTTTDFLHTVCG